MEIPCIANTFVNQHIQEFIAGNGLVVLWCVADRSTKDQSMLFEQIHCMHNFLKTSASASGIVDFFKSFHAQCQRNISKSLHILTEFLIDQRSVCKCIEHTLIMLLCQFHDIFFPHFRYMRVNLIKHFVCVFHPFCIWIMDQISCSVKYFFLKFIAHQLFRKISQFE